MTLVDSTFEDKTIYKNNFGVSIVPDEEEMRKEQRPKHTGTVKTLLWVQGTEVGIMVTSQQFRTITCLCIIVWA